MRNVSTAGLCLVLTLLGVPAATAGEQKGRSSKWWQNAECKAAVGLSAAQSAELERIFQSVRDELRTEKGELERQETALSRLLADARADEAVVMRTIDRVEAARSALAKTRTLMLYRMHRLLSREQRARLDEFERQRAHSAPPGPRPGPEQPRP